MDSSWYHERTGEGLKLRAQFLEQTATAERGSATRGLQFADRFVYTWSTVTPFIAQGVISIMQNGKTNQVSPGEGSEGWLGFA